ncbi:MAG: metallophosphoesterase [Candidatus Bathyarchaeota archaeon]|nr:metallophosphoesterase [Candidatus Bathyarchaeota archaeon A05DMB-5]MDH7556982.1 metallophosphoesterase [Candidatus Bathyarchaeota archaeon]
MITPLLPHPAALIKTQRTRTMVIADLHIGWEMALSEKGIHVPTQTPKLMQKLKNLISAYQPKKLLVLGDVKHTIATAEMSEWHDIPDFFNEIKKQIPEILVIRGNHDGNLEPLLPENIKILPATGVMLNEIGFFHGHRWPSPALLKCKTLVMAHVHPVVALRDPAGFRITRQVWVKAECNKTQLAQVLLQKSKIKIEKSPEETLWKHYKIKSKTVQLFIMPSFNDFLGGKPLNERKLYGKTESERIVGPVLRSEAVDMENAETYLLDGTFLGTLNQLKILS